ncbi:23208_t:CDS:2, partial [Gigaspora rosea]
TITSTGKIILDDGKKCGVSYNDGSTTSNMINHLARQFIRTENEYELIRQDLISFIIDDSQPFNVLIKSFSWSKQQFINIIENDSIAISMTMDFWTSRHQHGYTGITCARISESWKSKETLLILQHVLYPHTGKIIAKLLNHVLIEWDLIDKMIAITGSNQFQYWLRLQNYYFNNLILNQCQQITIFDSIEEIIDDTKDFIEIKEVDSTLGVCGIYTASKHLVSLSNTQNEDLDTSIVLRKRKSILSELYVDDNNTINEIDGYLSLEEEGRRIE